MKGNLHQGNFLFTQVCTWIISNYKQKSRVSTSLVFTEIIVIQIIIIVYNYWSIISKIKIKIYALWCRDIQSVLYLSFNNHRVKRKRALTYYVVHSCNSSTKELVVFFLANSIDVILPLSEKFDTFLVKSSIVYSKSRCKYKIRSSFEAAISW